MIRPHVRKKSHKTTTTCSVMSYDVSSIFVCCVRRIVSQSLNSKPRSTLLGANQRHDGIGRSLGTCDIEVHSVSAAFYEVER